MSVFQNVVWGDSNHGLLTEALGRLLVEKKKALTLAEGALEDPVFASLKGRFTPEDFGIPRLEAMLEELEATDTLPEDVEPLPELEGSAG